MKKYIKKPCLSLSQAYDNVPAGCAGHKTRHSDWSISCKYKQPLVAVTTTPNTECPHVMLAEACGKGMTG